MKKKLFVALLACGPKSYTFSYDKKNNTITIKNILDSDEGMGSGSQINIDAVFTEVK